MTHLNEAHKKNTEAALKQIEEYQKSPMSLEQAKEQVKKTSQNKVDKLPIRTPNNETRELLVSKYGLTEKEANTFVSLVGKMKFKKKAIEEMKHNLQYKVLPLMDMVMFEDALILIQEKTK